MTFELDKKIPIAFLVAIVIQTLGYAFWMGQLSTRIDSLETYVVRTQDQRDRLIAMEVQLRNISNTVEKIEQRTQ
jgi:Tfp pilus assembly protein PilO